MYPGSSGDRWYMENGRERMLQYMSCTDNMYMYKFQQLNPTIDT